MVTTRSWAAVCASALLVVGGWGQDPATPAPEAKPAPSAESASALVAQLKDPALRPAAREALLAMGAAAVPAVTANLAAEDDVVAGERFSILMELGPGGGGAVPALITLLEGGTAWRLEATSTLAELVPWRAPDVAYDHEANTVAFYRARLAQQPASPGLDERLVEHRLRVRATFPRDADVAALTTMVRLGQPWRRELAIEILARRGAAARDALPALRQVLERAEPRILTTDRTVPLHRAAARAVLTIGADDDLSARARNVLAGRPISLDAAAPPPERLQQRFAELVQQLGVPNERETAIANLVALGELAAAPVGALLKSTTDDATVDAAIVVLRELGPRGAAAVPDLLAALPALSTAHTIALLRALAVTAPYAHDLVPPLDLEASQRSVAMFGKQLRGAVDATFLNQLMHASRAWHQHAVVDPSATVTELTTFLQAPSVETREAALAVIAARGESMRPLLPALGEMLGAEHPKSQEVVWFPNGARVDRIDRTARVQRLVAQAILVVAPRGDALLAAAREVLARPAPPADGAGK